jgi:hypothetical protein
MGAGIGRWARVLACAALAAAASSAGARVSGGAADGVYRFPSADIPDIPALQNAVQSSRARAIVVKKGKYDVGTGLFIAARDDLVLCGATGDPKDVVFTAAGGPVASVQEARHITFRGLTLETTDAFSWALDLSAAPTPDHESYVDDVVVDHCVLKGYIGVNATVRTSNVTVTGSKIVVTGSSSVVGGPKQGLAGILWQDGPGLFVGRTKFSTDYGVPAVAAVLVRGAQSGASAGDRASGLLFVDDSVSGDFAYGFSLADVVDVRARRNTFAFPSNVTTSPVLDIAAGAGRIGIIVQRANASSLTEDFELEKNRVRKGFYGAYLLNASQGAVRGNDFRGCGATASDGVFPDKGGAMRMNVQGGACRVVVTGNDFRGLKTPKSDAAVVVSPADYDPKDCFSSKPANRVDPSRPLYVVQTQ